MGLPGINAPLRMIAVASCCALEKDATNLVRAAMLIVIAIMVTSVTVPNSASTMNVWGILTRLATAARREAIVPTANSASKIPVQVQRHVLL